MGKRYTEKEKADVVAKVESLVAAGTPYYKAYKQLGTTQTSFKKWKKAAKTSSRKTPKLTRASRVGGPELVNIHLANEKEEQTIIVVGNSKVVNAALERLAQIVRH
jgi:hypothetical protein